MPLFEDKPVKLVPPPKITPDGKYFVIRFTYEVFENYRDYLARLEFYQQKVFTCARTRKKNLSFEEALISEIEDKKKVDEEIQPCYLPVVCKMVHCNTNHLQAITQEVLKEIKENFYVDEVLFGKQKQKTKVRILKVDADKNFTVEVLEVNGNPVKKGDAASTIQVKSDYFAKKKITFSVLKELITRVATKASYNGSPWLVNEEYVDQFKLETKLSDDILEKEAKAKERKRKLEAKEAGIELDQGDERAAKKAKLTKYPIEDLELTESLNTPMPIPSTDFGFDSLWSVSKAITLYKFLNGFRTKLMLPPFSLDDFFHCLAYKKQNPMIGYIAVAMLKLLIPKKSMSLIIAFAHSCIFSFFLFVPICN